ncbi:hypothetical protein DP113_13720 [Brasilonema octagenarum UFV-E1]|uniref:Uncharacterized protein n=1 Tax=Brasilonema sennae CENA114 TaxID=415709 RepID=A0A856MI55_9CYAN|nr:hypothetical protein [Brasilonema sennae]QDL08817.1 hypothetical protein DP114_13780 [Brasilonema sennae CENA114]QDL15174.1 hypothetical protein DP113_13720 [Brasilonema octagenarum UFV-E1]
MINLISKAFAQINSLFNQLQVKRFFAVVLAGLLVLTTNVTNESSDKNLTNRVNQALERNSSDRPQTVGEWFKEARETEGAPAERAKRIAGQSAEAVKDLGKVYPDTAERTADSVKD